MKHTRRILCVVFGLLLMMVSSVAFANYPTYLNGDTNYILAHGHQGVGTYVDKTSLNVQEYNPPEYIIAINVITAYSADGSQNGLYNGGEGKIADVTTERYLYNYDKRTMYGLSGTTGEGKLRYLDPNGPMAVVRPAIVGEMAFYLAYGIPFYSSLGVDYSSIDRVR